MVDINPPLSRGGEGRGRLEGTLGKESGQAAAISSNYGKPVGGGGKRFAQCEDAHGSARSAGGLWTRAAIPSLGISSGIESC
jgi:hypothetical protein